jgi:hypothetical protein
MTDDEFFVQREADTVAFLSKWKGCFDRHLGEDGKRALGSEGCVYAVGSAGRGEMGSQSDLDAFLVTHADAQRLDEILVQSAVIRAMRDCGLPDPSRDATFLRLYSADELERHLGGVDDDPENTFTVRMLLLLESRALHGDEAYQRLIANVVNAYWRNADLHLDDYLPIVLVNDIVRYWRVLLLNYEAKHARKRRQASERARLSISPSVDTGAAPETAALTAEQRLDGYKLRFSRCMTCYSMLARLLAQATPKTAAHVSRDDVIAMVRATPVQRLQQVRELVRTRGDVDSVALVDELLSLYRNYLELREKPKSELQHIFGDGELRRPHFSASSRFGDAVFELMQRLGADSRLFRYVAV